MCRACSAGGRRCPGDTAQARRARRYASAGKQDPRVKESVRGTPPEVAGGGETPSVVEHDLTTSEGIRDRAEELRDVRTRAHTAFSECMDHLQENKGLQRADAEAIIARNNVPESLMEYTEGTNGNVLPMFSISAYERDSTALGQKADQWLDGELVDQKQACTDAAQKYVTDRQFGSYEDRTDAHQKFIKARNAYYERKRELMGKLRENGEELEWTTGGTSTPARVNETIQASATFLPKDWIATSNRLSQPDEVARNSNKIRPVYPVRVRESSSRNHYSSHQRVTKREVNPKQSFYSKDLAERMNVNNSPRFRVVPEDEYTENDRTFAGGDVLVQEYHVARGPSYFSNDPGAGALDEDGNFRLKGRSAAGWEQHTYTDPNGEEQTCWRKPATRTTTNREAGMAELTIPKSKGRKGQAQTTATHELLHRCEDTNPGISRLEKEFVTRRTTNADGERDKLQPYMRQTRGEYVRPDDFIDRYVGKDYKSDTFFEVMTVGGEAAFHGSHGGFGKTPDPMSRTPERKDDDHHSFVLGTYMTA